MARRLRYLLNSSQLHGLLIKKKPNSPYKDKILEGLSKLQQNQHYKDYETCLDKIDITLLKKVSNTQKDILMLIEAIKKVAKNVLKYYIGATSDYTQRFCGDSENPLNPVHTGCHSLKGYDKMYVLGESNLINVISKIEESLIVHFKGLENARPESVGLDPEKRIFYVYVLVKF